LIAEFALKLRRTMVNLPQMSDFDRFKTSSDFEDVIRSVRRSLKGVEKTLTNVSNGRFLNRKMKQLQN
jgi:hypothetical protein